MSYFIFILYLVENPPFLTLVKFGAKIKTVTKTNIKSLQKDKKHRKSHQLIFKIIFQVKRNQHN